MSAGDTESIDRARFLPRRPCTNFFGGLQRHGRLDVTTAARIIGRRRRTLAAAGACRRCCAGASGVHSNVSPSCAGTPESTSLTGACVACRDERTL
jgi:hypothetical protein